MHERVTIIRNPSKIRAATSATRRSIAQRPIRLLDHRTAMTFMTCLATRLAARPLPLLALRRARRIARRRPGTVPRALPDPTLQLINLAPQHSNLLRLRHQ
jgi:hypothetical protein